MLCQAGNAFLWSNQYQRQQTEIPAALEGFNGISDIKKDIGREIWPRICINISSRWHLYNIYIIYVCDIFIMSVPGVQLGAITLQKVFRGRFFLALEILRMDYLLWQIRGLVFLCRLIPSCPAHAQQGFAVRASEGQSWNQLGEMRCR